MAIYMVGLSLLFLAGFTHEFTFPDQDYSLFSALTGLLFFDRFIAEYAFISAVILLLINGKIFSRLIAYVLLALFLLINSVQLISITQGGEFLSKLAIDNINHISILLHAQSLIIPAAALTALLLPEAVIHFAGLGPASGKSLLRAVIPLILTALFFSQSHLWIPEAMDEARQNTFIANNIRHTSPTLALYKTLLPDNPEFFSEKLSRRELDRLKQFGFILDAEKPYPLIKYGIYQGEIPFKQKSSTLTTPNIIVFFSEGISARSLSVYGSKYQGITPNLKDFAAHSMVVDNYFNHTAATYRGLHGQLCSLYPMFGGNGGWYPNYKTLNTIHYLSLPKILNQEGYQTIFLDSHRKDAAYVDDMMRKFDFEKVLTAEELSKDFLAGAEPGQGDALSDTQLYQSLIGLLKAEPTGKGGRKPFFIGLYNYGTHSWVNSTDDEAHFADGWNPSLNTIHNLDAAFGMFWSYFQNSPYAENTIIIFTTDHCHYPTQPFVAQIDDPNYQRIFVDRIPFILHDPQRELPAHFDAENSTSLDFTPTLLHYLGVKNQPNPFLGHSIFSRNKRSAHLGVTVIEPDIFIIDGKKIHNEKNSKQYRQDLQLLKKFIKISHALELSDTLWQDQSGS